MVDTGIVENESEPVSAVSDPREQTLSPPVSVAEFSRLIADVRRQRNHSQRELAQMADVSQALIASVARGKARMDLALVLRVLAALDVRLTLEVEDRPPDDVSSERGGPAPARGE